MKWQVWNGVEPIGLGAGREILLGFSSGHQLKKLIRSKQMQNVLTTPQGLDTSENIKHAEQWQIYLPQPFISNDGLWN